MMSVPWCDVCDQWPHAYDCPGQGNSEPGSSAQPDEGEA